MNNSLYDYISSNIVDGRLPDDFSLSDLDKDKDFSVYADGARDGIYIYHMKHETIDNDDYELIKKAVEAMSNHEYEKADELFILLVENNMAITLISPLQHYIIDKKDDLKAGNIYEYAVGTIQTSDNIEHIKCGLIILELMNTNNNELKDVIRTLALSDEFTLYCVYIMKTWKGGNTDIFNIAKNVRGWGKIHAVKELRALDPLYDEIRQWILKEGIDNDVLPSYSSLDCWKNGSVGNTLYTNPTYEQFRYIGKIIDALLDEDAVQGLSALDKRKDIIMVFLNEAKKMPLVIEDYMVIYNIYKYFEEISDSENILSECVKNLNSSQARTKILNAVKKGKAIDLAIMVGIDYKPYIFSLMKYTLKDNYYLCHYLIDDNDYRKELLKVYKRDLPLKQMISVPTHDLGFAKQYHNETILEFLLQELRRYPLEGIEFVETGLQCKPIRTRNSSLAVLMNWVSKLEKPLSQLLPDIYSLLLILSSIEVDDSVRKNMEKLLSDKIKFEEKHNIETVTISKDTLNILSDAISDIGSWTWWYTDENSAQVEFNGVQLYDYTKKEKESHSSLIALRFTDNAFLMVLDNLETNEEKKWYEKLHDDEIQPYDIETYEFTFNDAKYVNEMFELYKNKNTLKQFKDDEEVFLVKYILACKCYNVGFVIGGNNLEVVSHNGTFNEEEIKEANIKWWEYWKDYWRLRKSKDAYEKDYACELTIPVKDKE